MSQPNTKINSSVCVNTSSISGTNTNTGSNTDSSDAEVPSMQDLMSLLRDQSKIIGGLQMTIEGLNETIKGLNDKIESLKLESSKADKEVSESVGKEVFKNADITVKKSGNIGINVTTSSGSKNDHQKYVHKNVKPSKCLGGTNEKDESAWFLMPAERRISIKDNHTIDI